MIYCVPVLILKEGIHGMFKISFMLPAHFTAVDMALLGQAAGDLSAAHSALREGGRDGAAWILEWLVDKDADGTVIEARVRIAAELHGVELPSGLEFVREAVPDLDWLEHSYQQFPPFSVGPFFIYGSHFEDGVPDGQLGLQIDAATAFGSGEHGTTKGCLQAMLDLKGQGACPWNVLDMGTGSGILAIAAWKLWKTPVLAIDNDAEAVRVAEHHREINRVPEGPTDMLCDVEDGFATALVQKRKPFDLIIANILAGPLKDMAEDLIACVDDNGAVILSGILNTQAEEVLRVYEGLGLEKRKVIEIGDWTTLILRKVG